MTKLKLAALAALSTPFFWVFGAQAQTRMDAATTHARSDDSAPATQSLDRSASNNPAATADNQKSDATDLALTNRIRQRVIADKSLSMAAHNVVIAAVAGTVTLNRVVPTAKEKRSIEMKAASVAGKDHVVHDFTRCCIHMMSYRIDRQAVGRIRQ